VRRPMSLPLLSRASCGLIALAMVPASAAAAPSITLDPPVIRGNVVSLSASLTSNGSCGASPGNLAGCPANYTFSGPRGFSGANLWWNDFGGVQPIPQDFDLYGLPSGTYTVSLVAIDSLGTKHASNSQQFEWPSGRLTVENVALTGEARPRVAYRIGYGRTPFASATATIAFATRTGRRLGSFRRSAEPGLNLDTIPRRLRATLRDARRYVIRIKVRDEHGRAATARGHGFRCVRDRD
jgi:hypothetical protein